MDSFLVGAPLAITPMSSEEKREYGERKCEGERKSEFNTYVRRDIIMSSTQSEIRRNKLNDCLWVAIYLLIFIIILHYSMKFSCWYYANLVICCLPENAWDHASPRPCRVVHCSYVTPNRALTLRWRVVHESHLVLSICRLPVCTYQTPWQHNLRPQWEHHPRDEYWAMDPATTGGLCAEPEPGGPRSVLSSCSSLLTTSREPAPTVTSRPCLSGCRLSWQGSSWSREQQPYSNTPLWVWWFLWPRM